MCVLRWLHAEPVNFTLSDWANPFLSRVCRKDPAKTGKEPETDGRKSGLFTILLKKNNKKKKRKYRLEYKTKRLRQGYTGMHFFRHLNVGLMKISRSRFKQSKRPSAHLMKLCCGCFVNFWVIFDMFGEEIVFSKDL